MSRWVTPGTLRDGDPALVVQTLWFRFYRWVTGSDHPSQIPEEPQLESAPDPAVALAAGIFTALRFLPLEQQVRFLSAMSLEVDHDVFDLSQQPGFFNWTQTHVPTFVSKAREKEVDEWRKSFDDDYNEWKATQQEENDAEHGSS